MILYYVRHGDPIYNPDSLTPLGKRQAEAVGRRIATHGIDRIFASSSNRAIETATPLSEITKKEITILDWCNEMHVWQEFTDLREDGVFTWVCWIDRYRDLFVSPELQKLGDDWTSHPMIRDTKMPAGMARVNAALDEWTESLGFTHDRATHTYAHTGESPARVALFAHEGFSWAFFSSLLDIPYPQYCTRFDIQHTGVTVVEFEERTGHVVPLILQHSSDAHVYAENLPTRYTVHGFI